MAATPLRSGRSRKLTIIFQHLTTVTSTFGGLGFLIILSIWAASHFPEGSLATDQPLVALPILATSLTSLRNLFERFTKRPPEEEEEEETPSFNSSKLLQQYGHDLIATPLDTDLILRMLLKHIEEVFTSQPRLVFLRNPAKGTFIIWPNENGQQAQTVEVQFGLEDDLAQWLTDTKDVLQLDSSEVNDRRFPISREELARLRMLDVTLCIPLPGNKHLIGWVALGHKKSRVSYQNDDLVLLTTLVNQTAIALENAQLLEQANRRAAELEALQKISTEIQAEAQPDRLLTSVVEQATNLLHAQGGMVYLLEPDRKTLRVVVSHNLDQDYCSLTVSIDQDIAGQVVAQGQSIRVDNYHNLPGRSSEFKEAQFGAVLGVPLRWGGIVRGVLQLVHAPHGLRFHEQDIWLIKFFATQSAYALEKSQLLQQAQNRANQLVTLSEVSMAINATLDLETALQRIMDSAVQILSAEAGSLLLVDPTRKALTFEVVVGPTGSDLTGMTTPIGKGIVGTVAQTGRALIVNDVAADPRFDVAFDEATDFHTKDILCVPMIAFNKQVIGVIELINKQDGTVFSHEDSSLLLTFAAQAGIAIENARIFTRTDQALAERIQELQSLQMFDRQLQTSLELERVLDISLDHMMDALGLSMGLIGVFIEEEERSLYLMAQRGMPTEMGRYKRDPWNLDRGILGRVAKTGIPAWVNDLSQAQDYIPKNHRTRSLIVIPISREDEIIGVIDLEHTDPDYFSSDDVAFVRLMASHAAIAIQNARLFARVREANDAKSEFMRIAAHELKTPMTSIKGYTKLLQMGAVGELSGKQTDFLNIVTNNVDRMDRLVQDLLDVSRIEAGRIRLEIQDVQMSEVIDEVVTSVKAQVENKNLRLVVNIENLPELRADYRRMVQIVTNLVSNAYKYTPEGGEINIMAKPYQNGELQGVTVTVKDTGYGISEEDQTKLFTNFFRASDQNIRNEPGTGLGLSITKNMVESHGGELTFESELGQGSSFTFIMPLVNKIPSGVEVIER